MNHGKQSLAIGALTVFLALSATSDCTAEEYWPLSKLIKFSQEHNPDSAAARERIAAAAASVKQAESAYYPQLQMQSAYTRTNQPVSVFASALTQRAYAPTLDFNDVPDTDDLSVRGTLQYVAYSGGRDSAEKAAAKAIASAATFSHQAIQNELAYQVTRSYITLAKAREFIRATEAAVRAFEGNLGTARTKEQEGSLLRSDVLDLEVRLAQAREDLVRAKNANALAAEALINLLGEQPADVRFADQSFPIEMPSISVPIDSEQLPRAELLAANEQTSAADAKIRSAQSGYLPRVIATSGVEYHRGWEFDGEGTSYVAGALVEWDVFDGFRTSGKKAEAAALERAARQEQRRLKNAVSLEQTQSRLSEQEASERLRVTDKAITQARESVQLIRARYEQGLALTTQLIDAQAALTGAEVRRAEAMADQRIAAAAMRKAYGLPIVTEGEKP